MGQIYLGNIPIVGNKNSSSLPIKDFIDDKEPSVDKVYSSEKTEKRLEEVQNSLIAGQESMVNLWQKTILSATNGTTKYFSTNEGNAINKVNVQCYKLVPGDSGITQTLKEYNNGEKENFFFNEKNIEFLKDKVKIRDLYTINKTSKDNYYETEIFKKVDFYELVGLEVE